MMNSKPIKIFNIFCFLLLSACVSCEPPGGDEVQRYRIWTLREWSLWYENLSRFVRHSQPIPVNPIVKELQMKENRLNPLILLSPLSRSTDFQHQENWQFYRVPVSEGRESADCWRVRQQSWHLQDNGWGLGCSVGFSLQFLVLLQLENRLQHLG